MTLELPSYDKEQKAQQTPITDENLKLAYVLQKLNKFQSKPLKLVESCLWSKNCFDVQGGSTGLLKHIYKSEQSNIEILWL